MLAKIFRLSVVLGLLLAAFSLSIPARAQSAATALVVTTCGTLPSGITYAQGQTRSITQDTTGMSCGSGGGGGSGTVTSVGLALPSSILTVSGSPVTTTGTLTGTLATQTANTVFSGPTTGSAATPTFRALTAADLPAGTGTLTSITGGTGILPSTNPCTTTCTLNTTVTNNAQTGTTYAVLATDGGKIVSASNSSSEAYSIAAANTTGFTAGFGFDLNNIGAGTTTLTATTSLFDNGLTTINLVKGQDVLVYSDGANYHSIVSVPVMATNTYLGNTSGTTNYPTAQTFGTGVATALGTGVSGSGAICLVSGSACDTSGTGGTSGYSDNGVTVTAGTYYVPITGGGAPQTTEASVDVASPVAMTVTDLQAAISTTLGVSSTGFTVTLRDNGADTALTCTFNPSSATSCSDLTHSVGIALGDLIDWKIVTAGTIVGTPTITIASSQGTSTNLLGTANVWTAQQSNTVTSLSISTATFTPTGTSNNYKLTLVHASCPCTLANPSATPVAGTSGVIEVTQSSTGSDVISTWGSQYLYAGGTSTIAFSTAANATDTFSYYVRDSTHIILTTAALDATH